MTNTLTKDETRQRAKVMHRMHHVEKMSLRQIADVYNISRERVRQLIYKHDQHFQKEEDFLSGGLRVVVMGDLAGVVPTRVWHVIDAAGLGSFPVQTFVDRIDLREVMDFPNVGKNTIRALLDVLEKAGYDVSHLWAARNWQNYDPTKHRGKSSSGWGHAELYRLPSLYEKGSAGSEGEGLPPI